MIKPEPIPASVPSDQELATRQRLLEAAGEVFSERGFHDTTIREICGRAGANIAAVNYHFGDKQALYKEVLRFAGQCAAQVAERPAVPGGAVFAVDAQAKLRLFVRAHIAAMNARGQSSWQGKLIAREMMDPSPALDMIVEESIRPRSMLLGEIVQELLGPGATETQVIRCKFSVIGQCIMYLSGRNVHRRLHPGFELRDETVDEIADHVAAFSLGAIAAMRASISPGVSQGGRA